MKPTYLENFEFRIGIGYGSEKKVFNRKCIGISDAFGFELQTKLRLMASYPRVIVSLHKSLALDIPPVIYHDGSKRLGLPRYAELHVVAMPDIFLSSSLEFRRNLHALIQPNLANLLQKLECDESILRQLIDDVLTRDKVFDLPVKSLFLTYIKLEINIQIFFSVTDESSEIYAIIEHFESPIKIRVSILNFKPAMTLLGYIGIKLSIENDKIILRSHDKKLILAAVPLPT